MVGLEALLPETKSVLTKLSKMAFLQKFTFVGGSALAVHLNHRLSEDIDLLTWESELDIQEIQINLSNLGVSKIKAVSINKQQCNYIIEGVKVTFFANNWKILKNTLPLIGNVQIANLELLCAMKINTLFLRAKFRDYYDIYVINKEKYLLEEIYQIAAPATNNLTITLFQRAIVYINDIQDENIQHLKPKYQISLTEIAEHFSKAIKQWNNF